MNVKVTKNNVTIESQDTIHSGEFKVNELEFEFTSDYDDLVTRAVFTKKNKSYEVAIENDACYIPTEVLTESGNLTIGVYGYETSGDNLVLRYSPQPVSITVIKGSYVSADEGTLYLPANEFVTIVDLEENYYDKDEIDSMIGDISSALDTLNGEVV